MVFYAEQVEQDADVVAVLGGMAKHRRVLVDHVTVATSTALPLDVAGFDELGQDSLRRSSVIPTSSATSRKRIWGSRAMHSKTCVWLVTNCQP